jgi:hypothetical protein
MQKGTSKNYTGMLKMWQGAGLGTVAAVALLAAVPALASAQVGDRAPGQCEARFNPSVLEAGTVHEEVEVSMTQQIGDVQEIETPDDSGLTILWTHADEENPMSARVRVSTVGAEAGTWSVILWGGGEQTCRGEITIVDGT